MTKRIVSGIFILTALGALGVILAGALTSGEQLIVRFLTAVIVAALGLYVISDLRLQADEDAVGPSRAQAAARLGTVDAPANSTAAFMATVTRRNEGAADTESSQSDSAVAAQAESEQQLVNAGPATSSMSESNSATVEDAESGPSAAGTSPTGLAEPKPQRQGRIGRKVPAPATIRAQMFGKNGDDPTETDETSGSEREASPVSDGAVVDLRDSADRVAAGADTDTSEDSADGKDESNSIGAEAGGDIDLTSGVADEPTVIDLHEATVDLDSLELPNPKKLVTVGGPVALAMAAGSSENGFSNGSGLNGSTAVAPRPISTAAPSTGGGPGSSSNGGSNGNAGANDVAGRPGGAEDAEDGNQAPNPAMFEYSDELQSPDYAWPAPSPKGHSDQNVEASPFERASHAYEAEKQRLAKQVQALTNDTGDATDRAKTGDSQLDSRPTTDLNGADKLTPNNQSPSLVARGTDAAAYAAEPSTPVIDLRAADGQAPSAIDAAINAGEVEVISTLIEQGMLSTDGPISDRDVRTMVYVAFTSNELRKLLVAGGSPEGPNHGLELGPVELFDERVHAPAPKRLYSGVPGSNQGR